MAGSASQPAPTLKRWSAWIPIATPLFFFGLIWRHLVLVGPTREADEGIEARLFQFLMPVQLIVIAYFAATSVAGGPRSAAFVLALQVGLTFALFATIYWLEHLTP